MKEKVKDLIYLDSKRYISIRSLRTFYWAILIIPITMLIWGIVAIKTIGLNWKSLFPLISIVVWSLLYWTFVLTVQGKKKKTFELRFLVNGISGLLISSLFWILCASLSLLEDVPTIGFGFLLWILLFYLLFLSCILVWLFLVYTKVSLRKLKKKVKHLKPWQFQPSLLLYFQAPVQWACILLKFSEHTQAMQCKISLGPPLLFW